MKELPEEGPLIFGNSHMQVAKRLGPSSELLLVEGLGLRLRVWVKGLGVRTYEG